MKESKNIPVEDETIQAYTQEANPTTGPAAVTPETHKSKKKHAIVDNFMFQTVPKFCTTKGP